MRASGLLGLNSLPLSARRGLITKGAALAMSLRKVRAVAVLRRSMPMNTRRVPQSMATNSQLEPVRNFVCEAYHDHQEHVCRARRS